LAPGKEDSDVVTFTFTVDNSDKTADPTNDSRRPAYWYYP